MKYAERTLAGCDLEFQYSPELFNETEPEFALEVCEAVMDVWQPEEGREIILNFPSTVERRCRTCSPTRSSGWTAICPAGSTLPVRTSAQRPWHRRGRHGDGAAGRRAAGGRLPVRQRRAGGQRLPGHTGLNMYTHGVDPRIDFSDITEIRRTVEYCYEMPVQPPPPVRR